MGLPKIKHPTFNVDIPSTGKKLRMRPFLVREEKILLLAQTSENPNDVIDAIKQIINNCAIDDINIEDMTTFDLEYIFIKLRARSVSNVIDIKYTDPQDGVAYDLQVNLDDVEVIRNKDHVSKIQINKETGIVLRYPRADMSSMLQDINSELDLMFKVIKYCIQTVYDKDEVYNLADFSEEEVDDFLNEMDVDTFQKIQAFFETMPRLHYEVKYKAKETGEDRSLVLKSLTDFFTFR